MRNRMAGFGFKNVGWKIKEVSRLIAYLGTIASILYVCILISEKQLVAAVIGLGMLLSSWISGWILYGFGEIIDSLNEIEENTRK